MVNFNISVGITDHFMEALRKDEPFDLKNPRTGNTRKTVKAKEIFERLVQSAWECGDPGLVFLDRINTFNPTPKIGRMESTNPCGEQPLLPYESCNLGSLNLGKYVQKSQFDWELFREDISKATRFLDNVIDLNTYPIAECRKITHSNRKIGLGVMGLADALLALRLPYDSTEAVDFGEKAMSFLNREAKRGSAQLARERGAFPNWKGSMWEKLGYAPLRNATVSTVAPTGTISVIAGASSGIEPIFSGVFYRNVLSGEKLVDVHPAVKKAFASIGQDLTELTEREIERVLGGIWRPTSSISVDDHVRMQAAFQRHSDSAVSKTINLSQSSTPADVEKAYKLAYEMGCKGITIYRDQSRSAQVLERPKIRD
jgi:ribonucleoside-diphosphate reductase alpha chain